MERRALQNRFQDLIDVLLPAHARREAWPVTEAHAFTRIVLDDVFGGCYTQHLPRRVRAHEDLNDAQLTLAVNVAERLLAGDRPQLVAMSARSDRWHTAARPAPTGQRRPHRPHGRNVRPETTKTR